MAFSSLYSKLVLISLLITGVISVIAEEAPAGDMKAGAVVYNEVCKGCHDVSIAPTLRGIINRPAASVEAYTSYSDAIKAIQGEPWTEERISAFLTDSQAFLPGTQMTQKVIDPKTRADIIAFLKVLPPPRK